MDDGEHLTNKDCNPALGYLTGAAIGFSLGIVIGFLYAPHSGRKTREQLRQRIMWVFMSPRQRYAYLWRRGGSLQEWLQQQRKTSESTL